MSSLVNLDGQPLRSRLSGKQHDLASGVESMEIILDNEYINKELDRLAGVPHPPVPVGYRVSLMLIKPPETTKGGISLTEDTRQRHGEASIGGIAINMGENAFDHPKFGGAPWIEIGDYVVIERYAGRQIKWFGGFTICYVDDDKIWGRMPRDGEEERVFTSKVDPNYEGSETAASNGADAAA